MAALRALSRNHASVTASEPMMDFALSGSGRCARFSRVLVTGIGIPPQNTHPKRELMHHFWMLSIDQGGTIPRTDRWANVKDAAHKLLARQDAA